MAANTLPISTKLAKITKGGIISRTANTAVDGTGTVSTAFAADTTNGSFCQYLILKPELHNTATTATALRIFFNDGAGTAAANNTYIKSITLPATTDTATAGTAEIIVVMNMALPPSGKINCCIATTAANASWYVTGVGGDF